MELRDRSGFIDQKYWPIPGLIAPGLTLFFAAPKAGKTRFLIDVGWNVASGNPALGAAQTHQGDVLMILSETPRHDVANIWHDNWPDDDPPASLSLTPMESWMEFLRTPNPSLGALMNDWHAASQRPSLVIIDNLTNCVLTRQKVSRDQRAQAMDYQALTWFHSWAAERECAVVMIHHTNQVRLEKGMDWTTLSAGTAGINAVPDDLMLLLEGEGNSAQLRAKGRHIGRTEQTLTWVGPRMLLFDPVRLHDRLGSKMRAVHEALIVADSSTPGEGTPKQVAAVTGLSQNTVAQYLTRLVDHGYVEKVSRGRYRVMLTSDEQA